MSVSKVCFRQNQSGQISIMIAFMMSTFILFFAFAINVGMLVNAKINLQNAADLAAYAGAAVQARQLTQVAYLNYEMRRQYKKFLFRIYVLGNMAEKSFPTASPGGIGPTPMVYSPDQNVNYGVPTTCVIFNQNDNYCQIVSLPKIEIPNSNTLDAITSTLAGELTQIEAIRQENCKSIGITNIMLNLSWLYNCDPDLNTVTGLDNVQANTIGILRALASGLGIVPRELILRQRIRTMENYLNFPPQSGLTKAQADGFLNQTDPGPYERSAQAFYSAYYTLGNHTFDADRIQMDELMNTTLFEIKEITQAFDTYAIDYDIGTGAGGEINVNNLTDGQGNNCVATSIPITVSPSNPLPVGVYKNPSILTYYAIRLTATAHVLFSPFGDIQMVAYAAAQPFGSRIGPALSEPGAFGTQGTSPPATQSTAGTGNPKLNLANSIPNLPVREKDSAGQGNGWDTQEVIGTMYAALGIGGGSATNAVGTAQLNHAYQIAMAPNPYEGPFYTIMSDSNVDPFISSFPLGGSAGSSAGGSLGAFWAPIFPPGSTSQTSNFAQIVQDYFNTPQSGNLGAGTNQASNASQLQSNLVAGLNHYLAILNSPQGGENQETMTIARFTNPLMNTDGPIPGGTFTLTDPSQIKTSWNQVNRSDYQALGRVGYSVKFISFDSLTQHKLSTDGTNAWTNSLSSDPAGNYDFPFIKH